MPAGRTGGSSKHRECSIRRDRRCDSVRAKSTINMIAPRLPMNPFRLAARLGRARLAVPLLATVALSACGGGSGGGGGTPPPPAAVTVSGRITFDRIPFKSSGTGLNPTAPIESPARLVMVEALDAASSAVLASTATDANGDYSLQVPSNRSVKIRAKAQMTKSGAAPTWDFRVLNNANGGALYALDGSVFDTGTASSTRNLRAASGWGTTSYTGQRAAAPFAILDTVYSARSLILSGAASAAFPALNLYWSDANKPTVGTFCTTSGDIGTTFFTSGGNDAGNCTTHGALQAGIYILGDFTQGDTDEFDQHVIAHEFGHYVENSFSRSDSPGSEHRTTDQVDMRLAFSEGWGNAYSGMVLNDPLYRDSDGGVSNEGRFNMETDNPAVTGWFSEFSVDEVLWDLFDSVDDAGDQITLGFAPIYSVMTGAQKNTEALTSIFSFADALRSTLLSANPSQAAALDALLGNEGISASNAFGDQESNAGGSSTALPIYQGIDPNQTPLLVCGSGADDSRNKLGYRRFLTLNLAAPAILTITATGAPDVNDPLAVAASDPDILVHRRGAVVQRGENSTNVPGSTETLDHKSFEAGLYIIEVYDYAISNVNVPHCMTVSVTSG